MQASYFPYHPLRWRLTLSATALVSLGLAGWAGLNWAGGGGWSEVIRAALSLGLLLGVISLAVRLRPREGWGVRVGPTVLTVARATQGHVDIPWSTVREIRRMGRARNTLVVFTSDERQVLVPRHLFSRHHEFEALVDAIEEHMPPLPYDA